MHFKYETLYEKTLYDSIDVIGKISMKIKITLWLCGSQKHFGSFRCIGIQKFSNMPSIISHLLMSYCLQKTLFLYSFGNVFDFQKTFNNTTQPISTFVGFKLKKSFFYSIDSYTLNTNPTLTFFQHVRTFRNSDLNDKKNALFRYILINFPRSLKTLFKFH